MLLTFHFCLPSISLRPPDSVYTKPVKRVFDHSFFIKMENISVLSNKEEGQINLPPGFRFHPTNEELLTYYLYKKTNNANFSAIAIAEVDIQKFQPWDLPFVLAAQLFCWSGQFIGHGVFEKRAPALLDNLTQAFLLAPFFVLLEAFQSLFGYEPYPGFHTRVKAKIGAEIKEWQDKKGKKLS